MLPVFQLTTFSPDPSRGKEIVLILAERHALPLVESSADPPPYAVVTDLYSVLALLVTAPL